MDVAELWNYGSPAPSPPPSEQALSTPGQAWGRVVELFWMDLVELWSYVAPAPSLPPSEQDVATPGQAWVPTTL